MIAGGAARLTETRGPRGIVVAVASSGGHSMSKPVRPEIHLVAGVGVLDDAHAGATVKHRSRVAIDPTSRNLRQVHLIHAELHDELRAAGFSLDPGEMGENVTTSGVPLLDLPTGTRLEIGATAATEITGLRNPCAQLDGLRPGLLRAVLGRDALGELVRKAGVMAIALASGVVRPGDAVRIVLPPEPHRRLAPV